MATKSRLKIAIIGSGISGLSAAWLLNQRHDITVYERAERVGGHSNTVTVTFDGKRISVDTGFIIFNRQTYPNLTALFELLGVATQVSNMSFAVSMDGGTLEYAASSLSALFGQRRNLIRPRFWSMLADLLRFYRCAARDAGGICEGMSLGDYLARGKYGSAFRDDHLLPMAGAIWSAPPTEILSYPAASFIRFNDNHGLLNVWQRPAWETVTGGSRNYVHRLIEPFADRIRLDTGARAVRRSDNEVIVTDTRGDTERYDHIVFASHADQSLAALADPSTEERDLLGAFRYSRNLAVLHTDESFMPKRRSVWSSWNHIGSRDALSEHVCVTYWMNSLQGIESSRPIFVSLNPPRPPHAGTLLHTETYHHPIVDGRAMAAQQRLWSLQGQRNTWYCGSYFGAGFHEDGLQAGLAVAEQLGGLRRPWHVANESGRICLHEAAAEANRLEAAA
jgi:predicted NAD/FAD-binding protein